MADDDLMTTGPPPGVPGLDRDHPAQVRRGGLAPPPVHVVLPTYDGLELDDVIIAAEELRRIAVDWRSDPAWPRLHLILDLAYVDLLDKAAEHPDHRGVAYRLALVTRLVSPG
jgi:hypothetical protein